MKRQRNNPQQKGRKEFPERVPSEIEASDLSDTEFKIMVIMMLKELNENYKELTGNYISMKKDIETISKSQEEMRVQYLK